MIDSTARQVMGATLAAALACSAALAWSPPARAAAADGQSAVRGIGGEDCAAFVSAVADRKQGAFVFAGWLDGYISAVNRLNPETFDSMPWQSTNTLMALINNHCTANPQDMLFSVVRGLMDFYAAQHMAAASPRVDAAAGEKSITVYREIMRRAQEALAKAGVYSGTADGLYGPKTRAAFEAFQEQAGLAKSGLPDQETLFRLFVRKPGTQ